MKFPDELIQQAMLGTFLKPELGLSEGRSNEGRFRAVDVSDTSFEGRLLLKFAMLALQQQAGFIGHSLSQPLQEPALENGTIAVDVEAVQYFIQILGGGIESQLLPEWCRLVISSQQHLPDEYAPFVMSFGKRLSVYRIYLRGVLSEKAIWLAEYSKKSDWEWVLTTPIPAGNYLSGIRTDREEQLINWIMNTHPDDMKDNILPHFAIYFQPWSKKLAGMFLEYVLVDGVIDSFKSMYLDALENFAHYAPIEFHEKLQPYLAKPTKTLDMAERFEAIQETMSIRAAIHTSIFRYK